MIRPGMVLTVRRPAAPSPPAPSPRGPGPPAPGAAVVVGASGQRAPSPPAGTGAPAASGMPRWLKTTLLAAALVVGTAFLAEPVLLVLRAAASARAAAVPEQAREPVLVPPPRGGREPDPGRPAAEEARIVLADYDRVVVTRSLHDGTIYVLRPPGADPRVILRAARLVLPEDLYRELAGQLGMPVSWPIVVADYDRVVVTQSKRDGAVCVLGRRVRIPG